MTTPNPSRVEIATIAEIIGKKKAYTFFKTLHFITMEYFTKNDIENHDWHFANPDRTFTTFLSELEKESQDESRDTWKATGKYRFINGSIREKKRKNDCHRHLRWLITVRIPVCSLRLSSEEIAKITGKIICHLLNDYQGMGDFKEGLAAEVVKNVKGVNIESLEVGKIRLQADGEYFFLDVAYKCEFE